LSQQTKPATEKAKLKLRYRTGDQALVREINLSIVFNRLWTHAPLSRAQLADVTGLNKTTVSSLVQDLLAKGFAREAGLRSSRGGRPATLIELNPQAGCMLGVEIGVDFISAILTNFRAEIEWRHHESTATQAGHQMIIQRARSIIQDGIQVAERRGMQVLGVGVGVPGLVDPDSGIVHFAPNLEWRDVPLRALVLESLSLPILVDNDANLSALGEYYFGTARGMDTFIYITIGTGLGGGLFLDGQPYRGVGGYAGEFGHMSLTDNGLRCNCGNYGCWETVVSISAVVRRAQSAVETQPASRMLDLADHQASRITLPVVIQAAEQGDETALQVLHQTGHYLGIGITNLVNAFNPGLIVLGGGLSPAYPFMVPVAQRVVADRTMATPAKSTRIVASSYGEDACVFGAVGYVLHEMLTMPNYSLPAAVNN
jgi:glucokinase-like ROK family protein